MKQETLSDKIIQGKFNQGEIGSYIMVGDIKEAVKRLKNEFCRKHHIAHEINEKIIDEIFGSKLT